ncbi:MAG: hypothetical protein AB7P04_13660 [Bacteriovoracia bacterium]
MGKFSSTLNRRIAIGLCMLASFGCGTRFLNPVEQQTLAYVVTASALETYVIDDTGRATFISRTLNTFQSANDILKHPQYPLLYVSDYTAGKILVFQINSANGSSYLAGSATHAGTAPIAFASESGRLLSASLTAGKVASFAAGTDGSLSDKKILNAGGVNPDVGTDADRRFVFISDSTGGPVLYVFKDGTSLTSATQVSGAITCLACFYASRSGTDWLFVVNQISGKLQSISFDGSDGALTAHATLLQANGIPADAASALMHPTLPIVYVLGSTSIAVISVNLETGAMTRIATHAYPTGAATNSLRTADLDPGGKFFYYVSGSSFYSYPIDATSGVLGTVPEITTLGSSGAKALKIVRLGLALHH